MAIRLKRYDKISQRIYSDDKIVAMALLLSNGMWSLCDTYKKRLTQRQFLTPKAACREFTQHHASSLPSQPRGSEAE